VGEQPRFKADPNADIRTVELEGLTLLFHRPSGATHVLAPPAPQILELLRGAPATPAEIRERLDERFDLEGDEAELAARISELESAGLISRAG
jgi:PqqD family protein of HPr-rel-A system